MSLNKTLSESKIGTNRSKSNKSVNNLKNPPLEIFSRLRPNKNKHNNLCLKVLSSTTIKLFQPDNLNMNSNRFESIRENYYNFKKIFDENSKQFDLFRNIGLPLTKSLIKGQNTLLLLYGQSGSGKTYTMNGDHCDFGILPRCVNTIFKNITTKQSTTLMFRQDKCNNYYLFNRDIGTMTSDNRINNNFIKFKFDDNIDDDFMLSSANSIYAIFITYVEVYNNAVYDLLDEKGINKWQNKPIREDNQHKVHVHGIKEIEVQSVEETLEIFFKAQKRRRTQHTSINNESNRSHSVFTIKLIQTNLNQNNLDCNELLKNHSNNDIKVSQLCFVDLAGGERTMSSKNTGQRLRESGNINNSLMTLRYCLETLRENQLNGMQKVIPYRDTKITHLFKNYFDGDGFVSLLVCINPSVENYGETYKALKFSGDIQAATSSTAKLSPILITRKIPKLHETQQIENHYGDETKMSITNHCNNDNETTDSNVINDLMKFFENRIKKKQTKITHDTNRNVIEKEYLSIREENNKLLELIDDERIRNKNLENDYNLVNENLRQYINRTNELQNLLNLEKSRFSKLENDTRFQDYHLNTLLEEEKLRSCKLEKNLKDLEIEVTQLKMSLLEIKESNEKVKHELSLTVEKLKNKIQRKDILIADLNKQIIEAKNLEKLNKRNKTRRNERFIRSADNTNSEILLSLEPCGVTGIFIKQKFKNKEISRTEDHKRIRPKTISTLIKKRDRIDKYDNFDFC